MWGTLIVFLLVIAGITWWDARRIKKKHRKKDLWVYLGLMGVVMLFGVVSIMGLRIPSPLDPLQKVFVPFGKLMIGE